MVKTKKTARLAKPSAKKTAKKTTRKAAAPKTAAKKKENKDRALVCAPDSSCFWTNDGSILKDLVDLRDAFLAMDDAVFSYHANTHKNDFAQWVEDVLNDNACAAALRKAKRANTACAVVVRHLRTYRI